MSKRERVLRPEDRGTRVSGRGPCCSLLGSTRFGQRRKVTGEDEPDELLGPVPLAPYEDGGKALVSILSDADGCRVTQGLHRCRVQREGFVESGARAHPRSAVVSQDLEAVQDDGVRAVHEVGIVVPSGHRLAAEVDGRWRSTSAGCNPSSIRG